MKCKGERVRIVWWWLELSQGAPLFVPPTGCQPTEAGTPLHPALFQLLVQGCALHGVGALCLPLCLPRGDRCGQRLATRCQCNPACGMAQKRSRLCVFLIGCKTDDLEDK